MGDYEDGFEAGLRSESVGWSRRNREELAALRAHVADVIAKCEAAAVYADTKATAGPLAMQLSMTSMGIAHRQAAAWLREFPVGDEQHG